ncbi:hypothetical protein ACFSTC_33690 [Nonomuraea ferruginea]
MGRDARRGRLRRRRARRAGGGRARRHGHEGRPGLGHRAGPAPAAGAAADPELAGGVASSAEKWDAFGAALATGDFDGDGRDDLAIGVPGEGLTAGQRAMDYGDGALHVVYGTRNGLRGARSEMWTQRLLKGEPRYYDRFGASLAAGDLDGDGDDELAVGGCPARTRCR